MKLEGKLRAASWHAAISLLVALCVVWLILGVWYPAPYLYLSGGIELLRLVVGVDVIVGPFLTLFVYQESKTRRAKVFDFFVIGLLQIFALAYGVFTVAAARPVHMVFEKDLLRVVHASDVYQSVGTLLVELPWTGPTLKSVRMPESSSARNQILTDALKHGIYEAYRPELWRPYDEARVQIREKARPLMEVMPSWPLPIQKQAREQLDKLATKTDQVLVLPVVGRNFAEATALLDAYTLQPIAFING